MKISIKCPAGCKGTGFIRIIHEPCEFCEHTGTVHLTKYLKILNKELELKSVLWFETYNPVPVI